MKKPEIKKGKVYEPSVLWICRTCGSFNLCPVEWGEFECICCATIYQIYFQAEEGD